MSDGTMSSSKVMALWTDLCQIITDLQQDIEKNVRKQNIAAGVRVRKGLRVLRKQATLILKESMATDKSAIETRKVKKASKTETPTE